MDSYKKTNGSSGNKLVADLMQKKNGIFKNAKKA
jgi:hypothetical protein